MMSYWHTFGRKKAVKRDGLSAQRQSVAVEPARPAETAAPAGDERLADKHNDAVGVGGSAPAPQAVQQVIRPRTYEEKALALSEFAIDQEAANLVDYVTNSVSHLVLLGGPQQHNLYAHFREVLRRCAIVHMQLPDEE